MVLRGLLAPEAEAELIGAAAAAKARPAPGLVSLARGGGEPARVPTDPPGALHLVDRAQVRVREHLVGVGELHELTLRPLGVALAEGVHIGVENLQCVTSQKKVRRTAEVHLGFQQELLLHCGG